MQNFNFKIDSIINTHDLNKSASLKYKYILQNSNPNLNSTVITYNLRNTSITWAYNT